MLPPTFRINDHKKQKGMCSRLLVLFYFLTKIFVRPAFFLISGLEKKKKKKVTNCRCIIIYLLLMLRNAFRKVYIVSRWACLRKYRVASRKGTSYLVFVHFAHRLFYYVGQLAIMFFKIPQN